MSVTYNPRIVTDGLVLCLDAANRRSYPGSGTTWNDMSGNNNNGTLTNGPTYSVANGGSITFDNTNKYVSVTGSIVTSAATFIVWIKRNGTQNQYDGIVHSRGTNVTGINFYTNNQLGYHWNDAANTYTWSSGLILPDLTWCMCAVSISSSSAIAYLCQSTGITSATNNVSHASSTINAITIGKDLEGTSRYFSGNIAFVLLYNKALSTSEILQNYNATKRRFL